MENRLDLRIRLEKFLKTKLFIYFIYLILPYIFFAIGINIFKIALAPGDGSIFGVPTKIFTVDLQLWNPYIQSGTFPFKDIGWQSLYLPGIVVMRLFPNLFGYNLLLLFHYSMAGFFTFLFLTKLKLKNTASFIGGVTFMFSGFLSAHKGHHTMMMASAYLPVVLCFFESFVGSKKISMLFLSALAFGLSILADYTAVSMYIGMVTFPYIIFRVLTDPESHGKPILKKILAIAVISSVIFIVGLLISAVEIVPILESLNYVTRAGISYDFFASYSFSFKLLPLLIFPYIYGTHSPSFFQPAYFGPWNLTEMAGYMGILPVLSAGLAFFLFRKKNEQIYFWTAVSFVAFMLVLGDSTPLYKLMYRVPVYNMFRASARNWLEVNFAIAILSSYFVHYIITDGQLNKQRYYGGIHWITAGLFAIVLFILVAAKELISSQEIKQLWLENTRIISPAVYIPLIIIFISIALLYLLYRYRGNRTLWILITITLFFDLFSFGHFHDTAYPDYKFFQSKLNEVAEFFDSVNTDKNQYRVLSLNMMDFENQLYPSMNLLYGFNVTNGYSSIWLKDYKDLTTFEANGLTTKKYQLLDNSRILSLLSTRYIITSDPVDKNFLQTLLVNTKTGSDKLIVDGFNNNAWNFFSPERVTDHSIVLKSKDLREVSLIQIPFGLQPKTNYEVTFKARVPDSVTSGDNTLIVDFLGENYDGLEQEAQFDATMMTDEFQEFSTVFYSGETSPESAYLRFFTFSNMPYEIKDVRLITTSSAVQYWGNKQFASGTFFLYDKKYESSTGVAVYENLNFLPRARFVENIIVAKDSAAVIGIMWYDDNFNPSATALVEGYAGNTNFHDGEVLSADYSNNSVVTLMVRTGQSGFLVLSDSWYPGWKAFVDGEETEIYKTNAVSRGVLIEGAGEHQVQFRFVPMSFYIGLGITSATLVAMIVAISVQYFSLIKFSNH